MTAARGFQAALIVSAELLTLCTAAAQNPRLAEHMPQVTWVARLKPVQSLSSKSFAEARAIPLEAPGPPSPVTVSFTCMCDAKTATIVVNAPDARNIQAVVLRRMRFPGDTEGPLLMNVLEANHTSSAASLSAPVPADQFDRVSGVILNQQCMATVTMADPPTMLAGPILMYKSAMR